MTHEFEPGDLSGWCEYEYPNGKRCGGKVSDPIHNPFEPHSASPEAKNEPKPDPECSRCKTQQVNRNHSIACQRYQKHRMSLHEQAAKYDGLDRLGMAVYGRKPEPREYIGGSSAVILEDAATVITEQRERILTLEKELEEHKRYHRLYPSHCPRDIEDRD
jgi:hypothetical protein